ncbi:hypothetical protein EJ02DRAFT_410392 [Clathrospora elynae]|uniref:Zn(2)-C6 fungal-type domain-containing protein n=1 Tax=Clathrospora elynae TaxID=706981 RepID=A0A6A5SMH3_9PLEO|nr:hypothetical protein EJ02DRAFT_410392 [Clathrospora elynae]
MRPLRPLLPTTTRPQNLPAPPSLPRDRVASACDQCRSRKIKCNGERPACLECVKRETTCHYATRSMETQGQALKRKHDALQAQNDAYAELFHLIRTRSDHESHEILRRIKMGTDVDVVVRHIKEADLLIQLTLRPETKLCYSLPNSNTITASVEVSSNAYLASPSHDEAIAQPVTSPFNKPADGDLNPNYTTRVVEPTLERVHARDWTTVISDNILFRRLISLYLICQHASQYWFNKDLFLEDMAARCTSFCSTLLVNAVLAASCQAYEGSAEVDKSWIPENLKGRFLLETKRLWDLEQGKSCLTSIHTAIVLHDALNETGMNQDGVSYTLQASAMARNLCLYDRPAMHLDARARRGQEYTAWAFWIRQVLECYHSRKVPIDKDPPNFPAPDPSWYGEFDVPSPPSSTLTPFHHGHLMKATIGLRLLMNDITILRFAKPGQEKLNREQVSCITSKLEAWHNDLPASLIAHGTPLPCQFKLHTEYQLVLCDLTQLETHAHATPSEPVSRSGS